jgi:ABC-type branched-subunit amino acid transport system substrate-binding protein
MVRRVAGITVVVATAAVVLVTAAMARPTTHARTAVSPLCKKAGLGYAGPLSGPASFLGDDQLHWMQLFISNWNAGKAVPGVPQGLKRVKLFDANNGDSMLQAGPAATVARLMVSTKSILGMVGFAGSNENLGGGPVLDHAKLAYVSGSATADSLTHVLKYFFRVVPNNTQQADVGVGYVIKTLGLKSGDKVMVVDDGEAYGIGIADAAQKVFAAKGISVDREQVAESTSTSTADFHTVAQKAVTIGAKLVYAPTQTASDSETFVQLLHSDGNTGAFMATDGSVDPTHFNYPGAYISFFGPNVTAIASSFRSAFQAKYGATAASDPFGAPSFVAAEMLGVAISQSCAAGHGTTSRAAVAKTLKSVKLATTILGYGLAFNNIGDVRKGPAQGVTVFKVQPSGTYNQVFPAG